MELMQANRQWSNPGRMMRNSCPSTPWSVSKGLAGTFSWISRSLE